MEEPKHADFYRLGPRDKYQPRFFLAPEFRRRFFTPIFFKSVLEGVTSAGISYLLHRGDRKIAGAVFYLLNPGTALEHLNHQRITSITQHHDNRLLGYFITPLFDMCAMQIEPLNPNKQELRMLLPCHDPGRDATVECC